MREINAILTDLPVNDLDLYMELGNNAGAQGKIEESIDWYMRGLDKARELEDPKGIRKFSGLIALSL